MKKTDAILTPEQFLADFPPPVQVLANRLRSLVKAAVPTAIETVYPGWKLIGYKIPAGKRKAYFGFVWPTVDRAALGFEYGVLLNDPHGLLSGAGTQVRLVTIRQENEIQPDKLMPMIAEATGLALLSKNERQRLLFEANV